MPYPLEIGIRKGMLYGCRRCGRAAYCENAEAFIHESGCPTEITVTRYIPDRLIVGGDEAAADRRWYRLWKRTPDEPISAGDATLRPGNQEAKS